MKTVYIIHGWGGSTDEPMHRWLKSELEKRGFNVFVPKMPNPEEPTIKEWVRRVRGIVGRSPDKNTVLVGHSIGCQAILRYLENLDSGIKVGGVVFIAPWLDFLNLGEEEDKEVAEPWLNTPIQAVDVLKHTPKIVAIFSNNDPYVSIKNKKLFEHVFRAKTIIDLGKGHFTEEDGVIECPSALKEILEI